MRTIEEQYELLEGLLAIAKRGGENGELDWLEFKTNIAEQSASITYVNLTYFCIINYQV